MDRLSKIFLSVAVISFSVVACDPWTPTLDSLSVDVAHVVSIDKVPRQTVITFETAEGQRVSCIHGWKTRGCYAHLLKDAYDNKTTLKIWHDNTKVYQATAGENMLFSYVATYVEPRWFAALCAFVFAIPLAVVIGRRFGLINRPFQKNREHS